jgi:hypothetical protein
VVRSSWGRSIMRTPACLTSVCVQGDLDGCPMCKVLRAVEGSFVGYKGIQGAFEELYCILAQGRQRKRGFSRDDIRGVSMPTCPLQSTSFLSQSPRSARSLLSSSGLPLI